MRGDNTLFEELLKSLGGQLKTGQLGSLQNRPTDVAQDVILTSYLASS
jgi:hypothetical protein